MCMIVTRAAFHGADHGRRAAEGAGAQTLQVRPETVRTKPVDFHFTVCLLFNMPKA